MNGKYQNCWEYWNCGRKNMDQCPVYLNRAGTGCWVYTDNLKVFSWAAGDRGFMNCTDCPWYKRVNVIG